MTFVWHLQQETVYHESENPDRVLSTCAVLSHSIIRLNKNKHFLICFKRTREPHKTRNRCYFVHEVITFDDEILSPLIEEMLTNLVMINDKLLYIRSEGSLCLNEIY